MITRKVLAEALGALLLTACVIGSGIMAERLAGGNGAVALLANTLATVAVLATLIALLGPVSGAHFNPVVSAVAVHNRQIDARTATFYVVAQVAGCCAGAGVSRGGVGATSSEWSQPARDALAHASIPEMRPPLRPCPPKF